MTDLEDQVRRLFLKEHCSNVEIATQLGISPQEVLRIANGLRNGSSNTQPPNGEVLTNEKQIDLLRKQVRAALVTRTRAGAASDFPASALVRLWQLIEDPKVLTAGDEDDGDVFGIPEETREAIFKLLDGVPLSTME